MIFQLHQLWFKNCQEFTVALGHISHSPKDLVFKENFSSHSEGAYHNNLMVLKKIAVFASLEC